MPSASSLRLPSDSPVVTLAQRTGLFPYFEESLLERPDRGVHHNGAATLEGLRERLPEDDYPLFQLFSGATPQQARVALGLTFDQWRDAQETRRRSRCDWVTEGNGRLTGWLSLWSWDGDRRRGKCWLTPITQESLSALVHLAIAQRGTTRWWVPGYHRNEPKVCYFTNGFRETTRYLMLIKTMAVRALSHGMAPVEA